jgi:hypothetical protein
VRRRQFGETGNRRWAGDWKPEIGLRTGDRRQETGNRRLETKLKTGNQRPEIGDQKLGSEYE